MDHDVMKIDMQQSFKDCPVCNHGDGFHSMFQKRALKYNGYSYALPAIASLI